MEQLEYRVRPVTRYIVTRFTSDSPTGGSITGRGEFDNEVVATEVARALCKAEHDALGWPIDDTRIKYPPALEFKQTGNISPESADA